MLERLFDPTPQPLTVQVTECWGFVAVLSHEKDNRPASNKHQTISASPRLKRTAVM